MMVQLRPTTSPSPAQRSTTSTSGSSMQSGSRHRGDSPPSSQLCDSVHTPARTFDPTVPQTVSGAKYIHSRNHQVHHHHPYHEGSARGVAQPAGSHTTSRQASQHAVAASVASTATTIGAAPPRGSPPSGKTTGGLRRPASAQGVVTTTTTTTTTTSAPSSGCVAAAPGLRSPGREARHRMPQDGEEDPASQQQQQQRKKAGMDDASRKKKEDSGIHSISDAQLAERYTFDKEIGFGNWGSCWLAAAKRELLGIPAKVPIAIKLVHRQRTAPSNARVRALWNEFKVLRSCGKSPHPNIVHFKEFVITPSYALVVMDYYRQPMNVALPVSTYAGAGGYFHQLLSGVGWLHGNAVTHNDIKVANILVDINKEHPKGQPVLVDFGFATIHQPPNFVTRQCVGTPEYLEPARCRGEPHDERLSDIWALGITFFEIATGRTPFEHEDEQFLSKEQLDEYYRRTVAARWVGTWSIPPLLEDLCRRMLNVLPQERVTAEEALQHPFFEPAPAAANAAAPVAGGVVAGGSVEACGGRFRDDLNDSLVELLDARDQSRASRVSQSIDRAVAKGTANTNASTARRPASVEKDAGRHKPVTPCESASTSCELSSRPSGESHASSRSSPGLSAPPPGNDSNASELMSGSAPWEKPGASQLGVTTPHRPHHAAAHVHGGRRPEPQYQRDQDTPRPAAALAEGTDSPRASLEQQNSGKQPPGSPMSGRRSIHSPIRNVLRSAASRIKTPTFVPSPTFKSAATAGGARGQTPQGEGATRLAGARDAARSLGMCDAEAQTFEAPRPWPRTVGVQTARTNYAHAGVQCAAPTTIGSPPRIPASVLPSHADVRIPVRFDVGVGKIDAGAGTAEAHVHGRSDETMMQRGQVPTPQMVQAAVPRITVEGRESHVSLNTGETSANHDSAHAAESLNHRLHDICTMAASLAQVVEQTRSTLSDLHLANAAANLHALVGSLSQVYAPTISTAKSPQPRVSPLSSGPGPRRPVKSYIQSRPASTAGDLDVRRRSLIPMPVVVSSSGEASQSDSDNTSSPLHARSSRRSTQLERGHGFVPRREPLVYEDDEEGEDSPSPSTVAVHGVEHEASSQLSLTAPCSGASFYTAATTPASVAAKAAVSTPNLRPVASGQFESGNEADGSCISDHSGGAMPHPRPLSQPGPREVAAGGRSNLAAPGVAYGPSAAAPTMPGSMHGFGPAMPPMRQAGNPYDPHQTSAANSLAQNGGGGKARMGVRQSLRKKLSSGKATRPLSMMLGGSGGGGVASHGTPGNDCLPEEREPSDPERAEADAAALRGRVGSNGQAAGRQSFQCHRTSNSLADAADPVATHPTRPLAYEEPRAAGTAAAATAAKFVGAATGWGAKRMASITRGDEAKRPSSSHRQHAQQQREGAGTRPMSMLVQSADVEHRITSSGAMVPASPGSEPPSPANFSSPISPALSVSFADGPTYQAFASCRDKEHKSPPPPPQQQQHHHQHDPNHQQQLYSPHQHHHHSTPHLLELSSQPQSPPSLTYDGGHTHLRHHPNQHWQPQGASHQHASVHYAAATLPRCREDAAASKLHALIGGGESGRREMDACSARSSGKSLPRLASQQTQQHHHQQQHPSGQHHQPTTPANRGALWRLLRGVGARSTTVQRTV